MSKEFSNYDIGIRLKEIRGRITQQECSKELGVSREAISSYERGSRRINLDTLIKFCKYFNVSADYILGLTDNN